MKKKVNKPVTSEVELTPWEKAQAKRAKQQTPKFAKQKQKKRQKRKLPLLAEVKRRRVEKTGGSLLVIFATIAIVSLYFILPISRVAQVKVEHLATKDAQVVVKASKIKQRQTLLSVLLNKNKAEKTIVTNVPFVNRANVTMAGSQIVIKVNQFRRVAFLEKDKHYYSLRQNGSTNLSETTNISGNVPVVVYKANANLTLLAQQLNLLPNRLLGAISEIHFTPTKSDPTKLLLYMNDGNQVIANAETLAKKLAYYPSIVAKMNYQGIIDLEVGAYSYPKNSNE